MAGKGSVDGSHLSNLQVKRPRRRTELIEADSRKGRITLIFLRWFAKIIVQAGLTPLGQNVI